MLRNEGEHLAAATVSTHPSEQQTQKLQRGVEHIEFMPLRESWLDRISLGFPRANSW
jgi:hypothetical protein